MKSVVILTLTIAVFAGSVFGSLWLKTNYLAEASDIEADSPPGSEGNGTQVTGRAPQGSASRDSAKGNLSIRPQELSVEEMVRLGMDLKRREKRLKDDAEKLRQQEIHQQIALADIQQEQGAIEAQQTQVKSELAKAEILVDRLIQARQAVIDERTAAEEKLKKMEEVQIEVDEQHTTNTKKLAQWIQSMDEVKAAEVLREMANDGKMPIAVEILSHLEEREAAKILSSLDDAKLVQDLVSEFRNLKSPKESKRARRTLR
ncbi:MotE family protein [Thalassoglobus polymorphus]|uniref:Magnesium transporter MgtE intracellular domain-containing protein n=1 Tax=Thalassoglobus polymorphus TaxID=2527994 RepID=A0A517QMF7_9PLAN|nr:hypothetical protein [Thalassoglobus polymorphus]QDT32820.1 hypothetical protein Mal48_20670 [Thalassoglobus polymorphus]